MSEELKPCPFCDCEIIRWHSQYDCEIQKSGTLYQPFCVTCGGTIRPKRTLIDAIEAWNRRPK